MMGGTMDGIAQALSYSLHLNDGHFLEGSWDDAFYTRQWNVPPEVEIIVMRPRPNLPAAPANSGSRPRWPPPPARTPGDRQDADRVPDQPRRAARLRAVPDRAADPAVARRRAPKGRHHRPKK